MLNKITDPLPKRRNIAIVNPNFFARCPATKRLKVGPRAKQYCLAFDRRVIDPTTSCRILCVSYRRVTREDDVARTINSLLALYF